MFDCDDCLFFDSIVCDKCKYQSKYKKDQDNISSELELAMEINGILEDQQLSYYLN